jgi:hypothetical protein
MHLHDEHRVSGDFSEMISRAALLLLLSATLAEAQLGQRLPTCTSPRIAPNGAAIVPVDVYDGHVYVRVCVGERDLDFVLDTGAPETSIDLNMAKKVGLALGEAGRIGGIGAGAANAARIRNASLSVSGTPFTQTIDIGIDLYPMSKAMWHVLDGLLGYDFISSHVIAIDYVKEEMHIHDRKTFAYKGKGVSVPMRVVDTRVLVEADAVLADGGTVRGTFLVDVGSNSGLSFGKPFVDEHKLRDRTGPLVHPPSHGGVGGFTAVAIGKVPTLRMAGAEMKNLEVVLHGDSAGVLSRKGTFDGLIGGEVLRDYIVYFDYQGKRMILEPNEAARRY